MLWKTHGHQNSFVLFLKQYVTHLHIKNVIIYSMKSFSTVTPARKHNLCGPSTFPTLGVFDRPRHTVKAHSFWGSCSAKPQIRNNLKNNVGKRFKSLKRILFTTQLLDNVANELRLYLSLQFWAILGQSSIRDEHEIDKKMEFFSLVLLQPSLVISKRGQRVSRAIETTWKYYIIDL